MPSASQLIKAKMEGVEFNRILHSVKTNRSKVSQLSEDKLDLFDSLIEEIKSNVATLEAAIKEDDLVGIKEQSKSLQELFQMLEDSCES